MNIADFFESLPMGVGVDKLPIGWAVPHASHVPGLADPRSPLRERAFVADGRTFVHLSCCCGATPHELADDLGVPRDWLGPLAENQTMMLKVQRRLRENIADPVAEELLQMLGLTVAQALLWRMSDAGCSPDLWTGSAFEATTQSPSRVAHAA